ncbi:MAG TPA: ribosome-associated translation inhibitor RaiA [Spirochaetota bacterium]|nr:ribosome-associated translation inhibitor RaiA [Spirochaetota bacterium]HOD15990.1 ribosome-associated translation inhibitor RaiA [Spirochaetota bacterium]HPG50508.1 ribosome-associated translation inhibitor RaiA [Spirochaetota bacterium]HPN12217.1 ribosome-associated translation inhibitor RaiA [Spirochaetota bacterium]HQL82602.1 ribosome-associated translation inhibitor RaiA [Spirochaetota bacterium]
MNITVTGRHLNVSDNLRDYAEKKITKLEKYFNQLIDAHVILTVEKLDHISEVVMNGDGVQFHGREKAADLYSAIDLLIEKMEKQIRRFKEKHQMHKGPVKAENVSFDYTSSGGKQVLLRQVSNKPVDNVEAFLQMRLQKKEFILFKKGDAKIEADGGYAHKNYAVIYRHQNGLRMVELPIDRSDDIHRGDHFIGYTIDIFNDTPAKADVKFNKIDSCDLMRLTLHEAILEIEKSSLKFLPFYNTESQYINVITRNGNDYEVMVPAF